MTKIKTPQVRLLPVLAPVNTGVEGGQLEYDHRNTLAQSKNVRLQPEVWSAFLESELGTLEESAAAKQLSSIYMGQTAERIEHLDDPTKLTLLAAWFTQQSLELYGEQDPNESRIILENDMSNFIAATGNPRFDQNQLQSLIDVYSAIGIEAHIHTGNEQLSKEEIELAKIFIKKFQPIMEAFEDKKMYSSSELYEETAGIIRKLALRESGFSSWELDKKSDGSMAVSSEDKKLLIGMSRTPASGVDSRASLMHELAVHAYRSIQGEKLSDIDAQFGMSGYLEFEEGLGCYVEYLVTGNLPAKLANRQIAASLALRQFGDEAPFDRNSIFELLKLRTLFYSQLEGLSDKAVIDNRVKELRTLVIDRFFRGGRGVEPGRAVFTKDIVYAKGFKLVKDYVHQNLKNGVDPNRLFVYLLAGKFDPTNNQHVRGMANLGVEL